MAQGESGAHYRRLVVLLLVELSWSSPRLLNVTFRKTNLRDELDAIEKVRAESRLYHEEHKLEFNSSKPRMGVCMTGQMSRFELTSKLEHLIAVNLEKYEIDVVLVLARNSHRFTNPDSDTGGRRSWSIDHLRAVIMNQFNTLRIVIDASDQDPSPYINEEYLGLTALNKHQLGVARVESHVRQWLALTKCYAHFAALEQQGPPYDVFVKLRDDSYIMKIWPIRDEIYKERVVVSECLGFGGYNDKVAVVDAKWAWTYFTRPIYEYYYHYDTLQLTRGNPESLLRAVLIKHNVNVNRVKVDTMPVYTTRFESAGNSSLCFVFDSKKIGRNSACWPRSCTVRQSLFCAKCPIEATSTPINLTQFFRKGPQNCKGPRREACKMIRRRLRRHQKH